MKQKIISITEELDIKLKSETNASELIRSLLLKHYSELENNVGIMDLDKELAKAKIQLEAMKKIQEVENG
jgi:hypothetical protein